MWDPKVYLTFQEERARPAKDLICALPQDLFPNKALDLGAGAGNISALLMKRFPGMALTAVEKDAAMLNALKEKAPDITAVQADLQTFQPEDPVDLVFSNAVLHWVKPCGATLTRWAQWLKPGGVLAVQMPNNFRSAEHECVATLARNPQWQGRLAPLVNTGHGLTPSSVLQMLLPLGLTVEVWETTYHHVLTGDHPVLQWVMGTLLRPVLAALDPAETQVFLGTMAERLRQEFPEIAPGKTVLPFKRLFIVAQRPM